jgi:hypothetical protein
MNALRRFATTAVVLPALMIAAPAFADPDQGPVLHTDQLVVVTPNPPVMIVNGAPQAPGAGPSAVAPAAPSVAPNGAPQNEAWSNVSHINGSIVKVGERGDYLLTYKKLNISTNPIGWMFGFYGLSVSEAVSANVAIRGDANIISVDSMHGYEVGISAPIYFRRVYNGPFLEPGLIARGSTNDSGVAYDCTSCSSSSSTTMVGPEVLFGWHWTFDSGLNVAAAFGAARDMNKDSSSDPTPAGYFRIGYAM